MSNANRWGIAVAGFLMQMALGAVYAWSVFRTPLVRQFHWSIEEVTFTFTVSIFVLGVACFFGGLWLNRKGRGRRAHRGIPLRSRCLSRKFLCQQAVVALSELWSYRGNRGWICLYRSYCGPSEVVSRSQGLITGIAVGGFGAGALVTAPVATRLIRVWAFFTHSLISALPILWLPWARAISCKIRLPGGSRKAGFRA